MKKEKIIQLILLVAYLLVALVIPILYVSKKYKLFSERQSVSIWLIIVIGIMAAVVTLLIKTYLDGMKTKFSYLKQILQGFLKVCLPLGIILLVLLVFQKNIDFLLKNLEPSIKTIRFILICEVVGVLINPIPKWAFNNNVEGLGEIYEKITNKGDKQ